MSENSSNPQNPESKQSKKITFGSVFSFISSILLFLLGLLFLITPSIYFSGIIGIIFILVSFYIFPPVNSIIVKNTGFKLNGFTNFFLVIFIIIVNFIIAAINPSKQDTILASNDSKSLVFSSSATKSIYISSSQKATNSSSKSSSQSSAPLSYAKKDNCSLPFLDQLKAKYGNPKYYKYQFDEVNEGTLTIIRSISMSDTENNYFSWDTKNDLENLMSEFVDIGQIFFESQKINVIKLRFDTDLKDKFGKKSNGFYMDMQMVKDVFNQFEWKNLNRSTEVYKQIKTASKEDSFSQAIAMLLTAREKIDEDEVIFRYNFKSLNQTEINNLKFKCK